MAKKVKTRDKDLDPYTFGDSDAAVTLAKILSQTGYEKYCRKVSTKYHEFCETIWEITDIRNIHIRSYILNLLMKDNRESVEKLNLPEDVKSYLLNVMNRVYKTQAKHCRCIIIGAKAKEQRERYLDKIRRSG